MYHAAAKMSFNHSRGCTHSRGFSTFYKINIYIYFYHRTLGGPQTDELPTREPGTRSRMSAGFMAPGHETPRARRGVFLGRRGAVRSLMAMCAPRPCDLKVRRKPEAFPRGGLGPPRTERVQGVASVGRARPRDVP